MIRFPVRISVTGIACVSVIISLTVVSLAAPKGLAAGAVCKVAVSSPLHVGTVFGGAVNGRGRFDCVRGQKGARFAVIVDLKPTGGTRWVALRTARSTYRVVVGRRQYRLARRAPCYPASYRTRAVLTVAGRTMRAVSTVSKMTCAAARGYGTTCDVQAKTPAIVGGQAVGTGTVLCSQSGPFDVNLQL